jgi:protocatechuate 3,4-dioxygenase alpha subunit
MSGITPSQTVGPYFSYCLTPARYPLREVFSTDLVTPGLEGERIRIEGRVIDGDGVGVSDAMIEIWQADAKGSYVHASRTGAPSNVAFKGFGRSDTGPAGEFGFSTIKPGRADGPNGSRQAPHIGVTVFSRGMLTHLFTRIYFDDEGSNAEDPVLSAVPADRRETLIAKGEQSGATKVYRFDIRMQEGADGQPETVFFAA